MRILGTMMGLWLVLAAFSGAWADEAKTAPRAPSDREALTGLKEVKMIFDVAVGDPKKLLDRLDLIEQTRDGILKQGVKPHFVVAFRGPASRFTQQDQGMIKVEDIPVADKIREKIAAMSKDSHLDMNQCALANSKQKVKNENTFSDLKLVTNSMITLGAYQNKGYAYIIFE